LKSNSRTNSNCRRERGKFREERRGPGKSEIRKDFPSKRIKFTGKGKKNSQKFRSWNPSVRNSREKPVSEKKKLGGFAHL